MGVWGSGLYSGDFAQDLRSMIGAVARLPYDGDRLVEILCDNEPAAANVADDPDHSVFWLVIADQFAKRGIDSGRARGEALSIIENGSDLAYLEKLGMDPAGLKQRRKVLEDVRARIDVPIAPQRPRTVLKNPQPLLMNPGELYLYPTSGGRCRNPYFASPARDRMGTAMPAWTRDSWAALMIVQCGRAFGFLSWYRPLVVANALPVKPIAADLRGEILWKLSRAGTCSKVHFQRMGLEKIASLEIDNEKVDRCFPGLRPGTTAAAQDISICNGLSVAPYVRTSVGNRTSQTISDIAEVLRG